MSFTRRTLVKAGGLGGLMATIFPEIALATGRRRGVQCRSDALAVAAMRSDRGVSKVLTRYPACEVLWDSVSVASEDDLAWVNVVANAKKERHALHLRALVDKSSNKVLLVQHTSIVAVGEGARIKVSFGSENPIWEGYATA